MSKSKHKSGKSGKSVKLPLEIWREVAKESVDSGTSIQDLVAAAVKAYLAEGDKMPCGKC